MICLLYTSISASPTNIAAAGGSSTITCSAVRSRQYTCNGVGQNFPETENGSNPDITDKNGILLTPEQYLAKRIDPFYNLSLIHI